MQREAVEIRNRQQQRLDELKQVCGDDGAVTTVTMVQ